MYTENSIVISSQLAAIENRAVPGCPNIDQCGNIDSCFTERTYVEITDF